uniref:Uncharacterized protein n=1 Tax=Candidatus Kentrum sp. TC TaxID=2126339 RepID=A0A450YFY2_9GAMM|nr:MAG: hypothetical protein BECKTC1821E_GA0114239_100744 [Candidatus Kentron sp. TC]
MQNPFNVTKAAHFTDKEVLEYWIDIPGGGVESLKPTGRMPMFILGGKGSGKTHLMRYFSYPLQKLRAGDPLSPGKLADDGFLGVYLRLEGLNAHRFQGKQQTEEKWETVFAYYMDIWLAQRFMVVAKDLLTMDSELARNEREICAELNGLFDEPLGAGDTFDLYTDKLKELQKELDIQINNCALTGTLDVRIEATSGRLIFDLPNAVIRRSAPLRDLLVVYLLDELEWLTETQQRYVNTLLRERRDPCSIKIGARLYGLKTHETMSAGETNREGAEFECLRLDHRMREDRQKKFKGFSQDMCSRRLAEVGFVGASGGRGQKQHLAKLFGGGKHSDFYVEETRFVHDKYRPDERSSIARLIKQLNALVERQSSNKLVREKDIPAIISAISTVEYPLLEKLNIFMLYQDWQKKRNLLESAMEIQNSYEEFVKQRPKAGRYARCYGHFAADMYAQLLRETDQKQRYLGLDRFVEMSAGLPRNLLIILKCVWQWAAFYGEEPLRNGTVSERAQISGVREASEWFYKDSQAHGPNAERARQGVDRLAEIFREIYFSDKPTECSLCAFSANLTAVQPIVRESIETACAWSSLIEIDSGQRDRNSSRVDRKFQLNPLLAPRWDLPTARRGVIPLKPEEVEALFGDVEKEKYKAVFRPRLARYEAPFFGSGRDNEKANVPDESTQCELF